MSPSKATFAFHSMLGDCSSEVEQGEEEKRQRGTVRQTVNDHPDRDLGRHFHRKVGLLAKLCPHQHYENSRPQRASIFRKQQFQKAAYSESSNVRKQQCQKAAMSESSNVRKQQCQKAAMSERQQARTWNCVDRAIFTTVLAEYGDS
jgi:hypothetical protein